MYTCKKCNIKCITCVRGGRESSGWLSEAEGGMVVEGSGAEGLPVEDMTAEGGEFEAAFKHQNTCSTGQ